MIVLSNSVISQSKINGEVDKNGLRQGEWTYLYNSHPLILSNEKVIIKCDYKNDTLNGKYLIFSKDNKYKYYLNAVNNDIVGFGYLLEHGKIRKTLFYFNINHCLINEFDENGKLFRVYELKNNKKYGEYIAFNKGKISIKQTYINDSLIYEEINIFKKLNQ